MRALLEQLRADQASGDVLAVARREAEQRRRERASRETEPPDAYEPEASS